MKHEILEEVKHVLENTYGNLDDDGGCYVDNNGEYEWLSVARIVQIIDETGEAFYGKED